MEDADLPSQDEACPPLKSEAVHKAQELHHLQRSDHEIRPLIDCLESNIETPNTVPPKFSENQTSEYVLDDHGILYRRAEDPQIYEPAKKLVLPRALRKQIMQSCHDDILSAHLGSQRTYRKIRLKYYWPKMYTLIHD